MLGGNLYVQSCTGLTGGYVEENLQLIAREARNALSRVVSSHIAWQPVRPQLMRLASGFEGERRRLLHCHLAAPWRLFLVRHHWETSLGNGTGPGAGEGALDAPH